MSGPHPLRALETVALIAIGGFAGANLRFLIARVLPGAGGTLLVNVAGSFVLGFVLYEARYTGILTERARLVLATGFLSSLTTYSTFALQTTLLARPLWMVANVLATYALGFSGVLAGRTLARRVGGGDR
ncbi:CrcB family protein [Halococcus dombrowskii]|uniref:Fluoride-specific ion channel FluC n=1 Tax=Halococcus dombrowskii TaxID=179637 RepID=A0AAV3SG15_HALDO|nr:CrcB family protein [Halococcus dombrowskii]UOO94624.1 CrcB family protein [Halococcus dombrowskii]